jgi:acyl-CoA thioesterase FadM
MEFEIITIMERSLLAEGQVTAVRMDRQSSRSRPPPPAIREGVARTAANSHSVDNQ